MTAEEDREKYHRLMMRHCPDCGRQNLNWSLQCFYCGRDLEHENDPESGTVPQTVPLQKDVA